MIPVNFPTSVQGLQKASLANAESVAEIQAIAVGQRVEARIEERFPSGEFSVLVAGRRFRMALPVDASIGDTLELVLVAKAPRPTFLLSTQLEKNGSPAANLSQVGLLIESILSDTKDTLAAATAHKVSLLVPNAPVEAKTLATALRNLVEQSGLFYESHLAQWVTGERPLRTLLDEPQGRLSRIANQDTASRERAGIPDSAPFGAPASLHSEPIPAELKALVRQQLESIDTGRVAWLGELISGQHIEWEIEDDDATQPTPEERTWRTTLRLNLPHLGSIEARLSVTHSNVIARISAANAETKQALETELESLRNALDLAGVRPLALAVNADAKA